MKPPHFPLPLTTIKKLSQSDLTAQKKVNNSDFFSLIWISLYQLYLNTYFLCLCFTQVSNWISDSLFSALLLCNQYNLTHDKGEVPAFICLGHKCKSCFSFHVNFIPICYHEGKSGNITFVLLYSNVLLFHAQYFLPQQTLKQKILFQ